jgi:hypothetical protein
MSSGFDRNELLGLLNLLTARTISPHEQDRLEAILSQHAEARKCYFAFLDMDMGLRESALGRSGEIPPPTGFAASPNSASTAGTADSHVAFRGYAIATIIAAVAAGLLVLLYVRRPVTTVTVLPPELASTISTEDQPASECVATLIFADECRWNRDTDSLLEGQRLGKGEIHLVEGLAMVRFDGGAVVVLSGNVLVDIESRGSVRLHHGRLTVRAPDEAVGFTVRTRASDVVDLGTEFAVEVDSKGAMELHVLDGAVEYRKPAFLSKQPTAVGVGAVPGDCVVRKREMFASPTRRRTC